MQYVWSFIISFILNDSRILYRVLGENLQYIKYKIVLKKLGIASFIICFSVNFSKGFFPLLIFGTNDFDKAVLGITILIGNYFGSFPGKSSGSEIFTFLGICCGYEFTLVQLPVAIYIALLTLTLNNNLSFWVAFSFLTSIFLFNYEFLMFFLSSIIFVVNYGNKYMSHFSPFLNRIKEKFILFNFSRGEKT